MNRRGSNVLSRCAASAFCVAALAAAGAGCGGSAAPPSTLADRSLTVWILENQPDRLRATEDNVARFAESTGLNVDLVGIGDDELAARIDEARRSGGLPDVLQLPMASVHAYARDGMLNGDAAQDVVDKLGEETFTAR